MCCRLLLSVFLFIGVGARIVLGLFPSTVLFVNFSEGFTWDVGWLATTVLFTIFEAETGFKVVLVLGLSTVELETSDLDIDTSVCFSFSCPRSNR